MEEKRRGKLSENDIGWSEAWPDGQYFDQSRDYRYINTWTKGQNFTTAVDYHYRTKRHFTETDADVIAGLSTEINTPAEQTDFSDRNLSPDYKMRIMHDLSDGISVFQISEKYNCSELAVKQAAAGHSFSLPVADDAVAERIVNAIKEGYNLERLKSRFRNFNAEKIIKLIEEHRILPASENNQ